MKSIYSSTALRYKFEALGLIWLFPFYTALYHPVAEIKCRDCTLRFVCFLRIVSTFLQYHIMFRLHEYELIFSSGEGAVSVHGLTSGRDGCQAKELCLSPFQQTNQVILETVWTFCSRLCGNKPRTSSSQESGIFNKMLGHFPAVWWQNQVFFAKTWSFFF